MTVKIYSTSHCPWCKKTKEFLTANKIKFTDLNIEENPKYGQEAIKKSGQTGVPVIDIDGTIIVGFDESKLKKALRIK
jgi:glutaredoxin 3